MNELAVKQAYELLDEASKISPGKWIKHSYNVGEVAKILAEKLDLDVERAQAYGYIHDIGKRYGDMSIKHTIYGYRFLKEKGFENAARICITHTYPKKDPKNGYAKWDGTQEEYDFVNEYLENIEYNIYDEIIQLSDMLALDYGFVFIERRLIDSVFRNGIEDATAIIENWKAYLNVQKSIENKIGCSIYSILPNIEENFYKPIEKAITL